MKVKFFVSLLVGLLLYTNVYADEAQPSKVLEANPKPNASDSYVSNKEADISDEDYPIETDSSYPGLFVDYGFNICGSNKNSRIKTTFFGSRFIDFTLCYNLVIPDSHFAIGLGTGYSSRTFSFDSKQTQSDDDIVEDYYTLVSNEKDVYKITNVKDSLATKVDVSTIAWSHLNMHIWHFVADLRFFVDKMYPKDNFICSLGLKFAMLMSANTEVGYFQNHSSRWQTIGGTIGFKQLSWGGQARAAWGRFGLVYEIMANDMFKRNFGPKIGLLQKVGVAIDLF